MEVNQLNDEFSFDSLIQIILDNAKKIIILSLIASIASSIYIFTKPNIYSSHALLNVQEESSSGGGINSILNQYAGIASIAGVQIASDANKTEFVIATIKSRDFFKRLYKNDNFLSKLFAISRVNIAGYESEVYEFDEDIWDAKNSTWKLRPNFEKAYASYRDAIVIDQERGTNFIRLSSTHVSPSFSSEMISFIIRNANLAIRERHLDESDKALKYLEELISKTNQSFLQRSITTLIDSQLKVQMIASIREDYFISIIDSPYTPNYKSGPSRLKFIFSFFFITALFSVIILSLKTYFKK